MPRLLSRRPDFQREKGFSLSELLVVIALAALVLGVGISAWVSSRRGVETATAAKLIHRYLTQTRMLAVYRNRNHFLVLNPTSRTIEIYADSGTTTNSFDSGDVRVRSDRWPATVKLAFPTGTTSVTNPLGGSSLTAAWSLPNPDSTARWGSTLKGLMATPNGRIQSAEATPVTIASGAIVLSDPKGNLSSVGVRGQIGTVSSFRMANSQWVAP